MLCSGREWGNESNKESHWDCHAVKAGELSNDQTVQDFVGMLGNFLVPLKKTTKGL